MGPVVLVVSLPGHVLQILHMCANEHVPELHEVTVRRVLHCEPQDQQVMQTHGRLNAGLDDLEDEHLPSTMPQG